MLNGYVLLNEVIEKTRVTGLVLDFGDHVDKKSGIVACVGDKNKSYYGSEAIDADVEVGDTVLFEKKFYGYLESELFAELPKGTGFCQRLWIIAIL
jgi:co-chaperonin GroES (HSP10)